MAQTQDLDQNALDFHLKGLDTAGQTKFLTGVFEILFQDIESMTAGDVEDLQNLLSEYQNKLSASGKATFSEKLKFAKIKVGKFFSEPGKPRNKNLLVTWKEGSPFARKNISFSDSKKSSVWGV